MEREEEAMTTATENFCAMGTERSLSAREGGKVAESTR